MAEMTTRGAGRRSLAGWLEQRFNLTETVSFLTSLGLFPTDLDTRRPLREAMAEAMRQPLPSYIRFPRVLGLLSVQLVFYLGLTGLLLSFYYQPTSENAHWSVTTIVRDVSFGWFVHQSHVWAARALLVILTLRVLRFFLQGIYKSPREGLWIVALLTLLVAAATDMTGRLLPWDAIGYWTTVRALEVVSSLPLLGSALRFLTASDNLDSLTLTRFYVLHAFLLPAGLLALFHLNTVGVRRVGLTPMASETGSSAGTYRAYLYNRLILSLIVLGVIVTLATLWPQRFHAVADPYSTPSGARPPWYLLAPHAALELLPDWLPSLARGALVELSLLLVVLVPFLDRSPWRPPRERRLALAIGAVLLLVVIALSWHGYRLEVSR